jgi:hypothetical protein
MRFALLFVSFWLCSCSAYHRAEYKKEMETWLGRSLDDVKRYWGPPTNTDNLSSGQKILVYMSQKSGPSALIPVGGMWVASNKNYDCKTMFILDLSEHVESFQFEGNGCGR